MDSLIVEGGHPIEGEITPAGNKNAAQPILAACLLTEEPVILRNMPNIADIRILLQILKGMGVEVEDSKLATENVVTIRAASIDGQPDKGLGAQVRGSMLLAGPLLARTGLAIVGQPGGDAIGRRRVDTHLLALQSLGATITIEGGQYHMQVDRLRAADIFLDEASVTGTEQAILGAVVAEGHNTIANAASEPHVQDLCNMLNCLGAKIEGIGSNTLEIEGVTALHGGEYAIMSDHMEVGSFIGLAAVTGGRLRIRRAVPQYLKMTRLVFKRLGVTVEVDGEDVVVPGGQDLKITYDVNEAVPKIDDGIWPAFPSDLLSIALVTATQSEGTVLIFEKMFENRLFFVDNLIRMGARIVLCDPHRAVVVGKSQLRGEEVSSPDIRAGMALLQAALCAKGESTIFNARQIDRGYQDIDQRLSALGAKIRRIRD